MLRIRTQYQKPQISFATRAPVDFRAVVRIKIKRNPKIANSGFYGLLVDPNKIFAETARHALKTRAGDM